VQASEAMSLDDAMAVDLEILETARPQLVQHQPDWHYLLHRSSRLVFSDDLASRAQAREAIQLAVSVTGYLTILAMVGPSASAGLRQTIC
jgi:hypothetical protein